MSQSSHFDIKPDGRRNVPFSYVSWAVDGVADAIVQAAMAVVRALEAVHRGHTYRRTVSALSRLDDHMLRDIGIPRSQIHNVARDLTEQ